MRDRRWLWMTGALAALGGLWAAWLVFGRGSPPAPSPRPGVAADPRGERPPGAQPGGPRRPATTLPSARPAADAGLAAVEPTATPPEAPPRPADPDAERARVALLPELQACLALMPARPTRTASHLEVSFRVERRNGYGRARSPQLTAEAAIDVGLKRCIVDELADLDFAVSGDDGALQVILGLDVGGEPGLVATVLGTQLAEGVSEAAASPETLDTAMADAAAEASSPADAGTEGSP